MSRIAVLFLCACACVPSLPDAAPTHVLVLDDSAAGSLQNVDARAFIPLRGHDEVRWVGRLGTSRPPLAARIEEPLVDYVPEFVPSDARLGEQWALDAIRATRAWDAVRSARGEIVAVVDSGVATRHPDLEGALWTNEGEVPDNGLDDDGNGYPDDVHGWDFVDDDGDPQPEGSSSYAMHGTHVAGIIGAVTDNARGIAGVAPGVRLMVLRAMSGRSGRSDRVADALDYAVENGARVINLSLGGSYSRLLDEAVQRAWRAGVFVVAASGNSGSTGSISFPASSAVAGVIGVAATDSRGRLAEFSNFGPGVDVTAPGVDILSTYGVRTYRVLSGTSMATPHVAGALALYLGAHAGRTEAPAEVISRLPRSMGRARALDLPSLVTDGERELPATLELRRRRLTFNASTSGRRPPPQTINVGAAQPIRFAVDAPSWVSAGRCRTAPCRLSFSVDPSALGFGSHVGTVTLRPERGAPETIALELVVGDQEESSLAIEALRPPGARISEESLVIEQGATIELRSVREGRLAQGEWSVDGVAYRGLHLRGMFARPGRYHAAVTDAAGHDARIEIIVLERR